MKQKQCNSPYGNRGMIFTLDATLAITIILFVLAITTFYITKSNQQSLPDLQTLRVGSDILTILDNNDTLDSLDANLIEDEMNSLLFNNHNMRIEINCDSDTSLQTSQNIPESGLVASGKRIFVVDNTQDYCTARFWVWRK